MFIRNDFFIKSTYMKELSNPVIMHIFGTRNNLSMYMIIPFMKTHELHDFFLFDFVLNDVKD